MITPEPISEEVLDDFRNRNIIDARNLKWANAEKTMLDADVLFAELQPMGYVPFSADTVFDTKHEKDLWDRAHKGEWGPIAAYTPPPIAEQRKMMRPLTPRQFRIGMLRSNKYAAIRTAIAAMPAATREELEIEYEYATEFRRESTLVESIRTAAGFTQAQVDNWWANSLKI